MDQFEKLASSMEQYCEALLVVLKDRHETARKSARNIADEITKQELSRLILEKSNTLAPIGDIRSDFIYEAWKDTPGSDDNYLNPANRDITATMKQVYIRENMIKYYKGLLGKHIEYGLTDFWKNDELDKIRHLKKILRENRKMEGDRFKGEKIELGWIFWLLSRNMIDQGGIREFIEIPHRKKKYVISAFCDFFNRPDAVDMVDSVSKRNKFDQKYQHIRTLLLHLTRDRDS